MEIKIGKIKVDDNIKIGKIELGIKKVYPDLVNLHIRPSIEQQRFNHPGEYGYDEITVDPIDINLQEKEIIENGEYYADEGYDGIGKVIVNVSETTVERWYTLEREVW